MVFCMKMKYYGNCTHMSCDEIMSIMDVAKKVKYRTLLKYVDVRELNEMFGTCPLLKNDLCVSFYVSRFNNKKCAVVRHSAIEYVFTDGWF